MFIVLPDLGGAKFGALERLGLEGVRVDVLVSYTILRWKPGSLHRLVSLWERGLIGEVMLDSGAYHLMRLGREVPLDDYARLALAGPWSLVVAPDVPGEPRATLERSKRFATIYPGRFVPVLQGDRPEEYGASLVEQYEAGILDRAPRPGGRPLVGIGGLDAGKRRVEAVARILRGVLGEARRLGLEPVFHLFGVGVRVLRGLRRRGLLPWVYSVDSTGWLAEIMFRRRTVHNAATPSEANYAAIKTYIQKTASAVA